MTNQLNMLNMVLSYLKEAEKSVRYADLVKEGLSHEAINNMIDQTDASLAIDEEGYTIITYNNNNNKGDNANA